MRTRKFKIAAVYDSAAWCWGHQAVDLQLFAPDRFEVTPLSSSQFSRYPRRDSSFDAILYFSWPEAPTNLKTPTVVVLAHHGCEHEYYEGDINQSDDWNAVAATKVRNVETASKKLPQFAGVISVNSRLHQFAKKQPGARSIYLPAGVNTSIFSPVEPIFPRNRDRMRIGFCGQYAGKPNTKGYDWVYSKIKERWQAKGCWEFVENTRDASEALTRLQMSRWYNEIDVLLITSISEGTPAPALEALACGRPLVTTSIGDLEDRIISSYNGYICGYQYFNDRTAQFVAENLWQGLGMLSSNRHKAESFMATTRATAMELCWKKMAPKWLEYVKDCAERVGRC